jgi:hypothetical protein
MFECTAGAGREGKPKIVASKHPLLRDVSALLLLTVVGLLIAGYHPGCEDDGVYLTAIKHDLAPALYPHDADFFALQLQATVFDKAVAALIHLSHLSAGIVILTLHALTIFFILWGCLRIGRRCFRETCAQWSGVTLVAVLLTLPVAGTALYLVDQNLHPRAMATAAILFAILAVLDRKWLLAGALLVLAVTFHPMMACYGISFCFFLVWKPAATPVWSPAPAFALMPLSWVFGPVSHAWYVAADTRAYYFLSRWQWYEWLGVFAPLALLWWFRRIGLRDHNSVLASLAARMVVYGVFQLGVAIVLLVPRNLARLESFQPMRFLHLLYLLFSRSVRPIPPPLISSFPVRSLPTRGCRPSVGFARTRPSPASSLSARATWSAPARIFTAFARWPNAAVWPTLPRMPRS